MLPKDVAELLRTGTVELQRQADELNAQAADMADCEERRELIRRVGLITGELIRRSENRRNRRRARLG
ncbi:MAG: hypothetical protein AAFX06_10930 [Planctomycetota bacterium]